jgi:arabinose-5-phosphate isomerase
MDNDKIYTIKESAAKCFRDEAEALLDLIPQLSDDFENAVKLIYGCKGKVIVTGVGKSGHIGAKIAATLASTGTPSFFMNPVDALHGDLGMIAGGDIVLAVSNSGQTDELLRLIPFLLKRNIPLIGMSGNPNSLLARHAIYHINAAVKKEACPLNLAPMSSTTAALAMGDALACALMNIRDFKETDYARFHPGGSLGKRLLMRVKDVMYTKDLPVITRKETVVDMLTRMTKGKLGLVVVLENKKILGLLTNGDFRLAIENNKDNFFNMRIDEIMNPNPVVIEEDESLTDAAALFKEKKLNAILVMDANHDFTGILDIREM